jgi:putative hydrolase of HD superfamily
MNTSGNAMIDNDLEGTLTFIRRAENLKNTLRYAFTSQGRQESAAEHSWRLGLLLMLCFHRFPHLHQEKLLKLAVVHDLAEAVCGDTPAPLQDSHEMKTTRERASLKNMVQGLPVGPQREILALWEEYESSATEEARCVKAFDKLETLIQHNQGRNPPDFDYSFNLTYAKAATDANETAVLLRSLVDAETRRHIT